MQDQQICVGFRGFDPTSAHICVFANWNVASS